MEVKDTKTTKQQQSQQENISGEKQQPSKAGGKMQVIFGGICVGLILLLFYLMETCTGDPAMLMMPVALLNPLLLLVLVYVFTTLFNNLKGGMILTLLLMLVFTVVDICAQSFRGVPLLAPDLLIAGTALSVADRFHFSPDTHLKIFMAVDVMGIFLVGFFPANLKLRGKARRNQAILAILLCLGCVYLFGFSGILEKAGVIVSHFNPQKSYASNGAVLTFIRSGQMAVLQKPEGYTEEKADAILADYTDAYLQDDQTYKKPNVIVMMNEAFSDVQSVGTGFETNEEVMPFIRSLEENTIKGTAYSSVFGGYTANSEYEFLTGLSMENMGGVAPFQFLIKKPMESLVTDLKAEGYGGLSAMHPFLRDGYQRPLAYENLGFSTYLGLEDIEDREHALLRGYVSDASDVDELIRMYEEAKKENDGPVFLYNVTMQNHAPYDGDYTDLSKDIQVTDKEVRSKVLTNYLNLIRCSDAAFEKLVRYFENRSEDTVIVMFGDHEPKLGNKFYKKMLGKKVANLSAEQSMERYKVPYVIWTNYDIEERDYGNISLNYLSSVMADAAGMKKSPMQRYLWDLRQTLPVITSQGCYDQSGFLEPEEAEASYNDLLTKYRTIRYSRLQGRVYENSRSAESKIKKMQKALTKDGCIVHAGGRIKDENGKKFTYTNSLESLTNMYEAGNRFVELDFAFTLDDEVVCLHKWSDIAKWQEKEAAESDEEAMTKAEFMNLKIRGAFTPMRLSDVISFMESHEDVVLITDIKETEYEDGTFGNELYRLCHRIAKDAPQLQDRVIVQIYSENEYDLVRDLGFDHIIYTLYQLPEGKKLDTKEHQSFAASHPLVAFTFEKRFLENNVFIKEMQKTGVPLFIHTVNGKEKNTALKGGAIDGVYTDDVKNGK